MIKLGPFWWKLCDVRYFVIVIYFVMHDYNFTPHKYISDYPEGCLFVILIELRGEILLLLSWQLFVSISIRKVTSNLSFQQKSKQECTRFKILDTQIPRRYLHFNIFYSFEGFFINYCFPVYIGINISIFLFDQVIS